jgi:hypothetical protein
MTAPVLTVFDPALCCSTGVCGESVDEVLLRFAADADWLARRGVEVRRHNLAQEAGAFAATGVVRRALHEHGVECLPLLVIGDRIVARGAYPERSELARIVGIEDAAAPGPLPAGDLHVAECTPGSGCC